MSPCEVQPPVRGAGAVGSGPRSMTARRCALRRPPPPPFPPGKHQPTRAGGTAGLVFLWVGWVSVSDKPPPYPFRRVGGLARVGAGWRAGGGELGSVN